MSFLSKALPQPFHTWLVTDTATLQATHTLLTSCRTVLSEERGCHSLLLPCMQMSVHGFLASLWVIQFLFLGKLENIPTLDKPTNTWYLFFC